jgi:hypothetical protein
MDPHAATLLEAVHIGGAPRLGHHRQCSGVSHNFDMCTRNAAVGQHFCCIHRGALCTPQGFGLTEPRLVDLVQHILVRGQLVEANSWVSWVSPFGTTLSLYVTDDVLIAFQHLSEKHRCRVNASPRGDLIRCAAQARVLEIQKARDVPDHDIAEFLLDMNSGLDDIRALNRALDDMLTDLERAETVVCL